MKRISLLLGVLLLSSCSLLLGNLEEVTDQDIAYDIVDSVVIAHLIESKSDKPAEKKINIKAEALKVLVGVDNFLKDYNGEVNIDFILSGAADHTPNLDEESVYLIKRTLSRLTRNIKVSIDVPVEQRLIRFKKIIFLARQELEKMGL